MTKKHLRIGSLLLLSVLTCSLQAEDFFFDSGGTRIHYTVDGQGVPVVLIHGLGLSIVTNWAQPGIIGALADTYQVIAIDNRGHGQSDKPHDPQEYGSKMVDDVIRLMDHLKIARAHVVGYSLGGWIASLLLVDHPGRLLTATLGAPARFDPRDKRRLDVGKALVESLEQGKGMQPLLVDLGYSSQQVEMLNNMFLAVNDSLALAAVVRSEINLQASEAKLRANKVPALALVGELDPRKDNVDAFAGLLPNLKVVLIPAANHMTAFRNAEFVRNLKTFLAEHSTK